MAIAFHVILCLPDNEMGSFLQAVKTKKAPTKPDKFFAIGFDEPSTIYATRGFNPPRNMSEFLLDSLIEQIRKALA